MLLTDGQINDIATGITYAGMCDATTLGRAIARAQAEKILKWLEEKGIWAEVWFEVKNDHETMFCLYEQDYESLKAQLEG